MINFNFGLLEDGDGRLLLQFKEVNIYLKNPAQMYNITSIDNHDLASAVSGTIVFSSFPDIGLDIFNRKLGTIVQYNTQSGTYSKYPILSIESNLRRPQISISGSKLAGQR